MQVIVHLHTILERKTPAGTIGRLELSLPEGTTMAGLLKYLEIKLGADSMLWVVNGRIVEHDHKLRDGDEVHLMPAISGGDHMSWSSLPGAATATASSSLPPM